MIDIILIIIGSILLFYLLWFVFHVGRVIGETSERIKLTGSSMPKPSYIPPPPPTKTKISICDTVQKNTGIVKNLRDEAGK